MTITAVLDANGEVSNYVGIFSDITERKALDAEIRQLAFYDPLTQLPNRRLLLNRLHKSQATTSRNGLHGALLILDLDRFKTLNDMYGHDVGDQFLIEVANRISSCIREQDSASRFGGDEFVVMLEDLSEDDELAGLQAETVANKILAVLSRGVSLPRPAIGNEDATSYLCTGSIGIALFQGQATDIPTLLKRADMAMYQAKNAGRNAIRFFDPVMQSAVEARISLENDLRISWNEKQFELHYQVQVDGRRKPVGAEVLIRWNHPQKGMIAPDEFITLAEDIGLIPHLGAWVLETACAQLHEWKNDPVMCTVSLSVNVSAKQFLDPDFVNEVIAIIRKYQVEPMMLMLELTESAILSNVDEAVNKMQELKEFGVRFSLDDFGTGYSSLSHLKRLPLDQVKIDKLFTRNIAHDKGDIVMVNAIVDMGMNFGLEVIAEGVETEEQFGLLKRYGCSQFQGYLFGKPVGPGRLASLIAGTGIRDAVN